MTSETRAMAFRILQNIIRLAWAAWFLYQLWDTVHHGRWVDVAWLGLGFLVMAALGLVIWVWQRQPAIVNAALIALTAVGCTVFLGGMVSAIGWGTVFGEGWYVTALILYLPLMGLGWLLYTKLKPRKP